MSNELDEQALSLAGFYMAQVSADVEAAVQHVTARGKELKGAKEVEFRNMVGTMQMKAHMFAALKIIQGSGMSNEDIIKYVANMINTLVDVEEGMMKNEVVH